MSRRGAARRLVVPEVVQTSAMDCGPAALKALLEGMGVTVSYGRLREACQTDVDGTSIDTIEDVAVQLGLDAEQVVVPPDHVLPTSADNLPAIVVVRQLMMVKVLLFALRNSCLECYECHLRPGSFRTVLPSTHATSFEVLKNAIGRLPVLRDCHCKLSYAPLVTPLPVARILNLLPPSNGSK